MTYCVRCGLTIHPTRTYCQKCDDPSPKKKKPKVAKRWRKKKWGSHRARVPQQSRARHGAPTTKKLLLWFHHPFCAYCGRSLSYFEATADHVLPIAKGGTDDIGNLVIACRPCNEEKGAKHWESYFPKVDKLPRCWARLAEVLKLWRLVNLPPSGLHISMTEQDPTPQAATVDVPIVIQENKLQTIMLADEATGIIEDLIYPAHLAYVHRWKGGKRLEMLFSNGAEKSITLDLTEDQWESLMYNLAGEPVPQKPKAQMIYDGEDPVELRYGVHDPKPNKQ